MTVHRWRAGMRIVQAGVMLAVLMLLVSTMDAGCTPNATCNAMLSCIGPNVTVSCFDKCRPLVGENESCTTAPCTDAAGLGVCKANLHCNKGTHLCVPNTGDPLGVGSQCDPFSDACPPQTFCAFGGSCPDARCRAKVEIGGSCASNCDVCDDGLYCSAGKVCERSCFAASDCPCPTIVGESVTCTSVGDKSAGICIRHEPVGKPCDGATRVCNPGLNCGRAPNEALTGTQCCAPQTHVCASTDDCCFGGGSDAHPSPACIGGVCGQCRALGEGCNSNADCCLVSGGLACDQTTKTCLPAGCEAVKGTSCFSVATSTCGVSDCNVGGVFCNTTVPDSLIGKSCVFCDGYAPGTFVCDPKVGRTCTWTLAPPAPNPQQKKLCLYGYQSTMGGNDATLNNCWEPNSLCKNIAEGGKGDAQCGLCPGQYCVLGSTGTECSTVGSYQDAASCTAGYKCTALAELGLPFPDQYKGNTCSITHLGQCVPTSCVPKSHCFQLTDQTNQCTDSIPGKEVLGCTPPPFLP